MQEIKQKYSEEISAWFNSAQTLLSRMPSPSNPVSIFRGKHQHWPSVHCNYNVVRRHNPIIATMGEGKRGKWDKRPDCLLDPWSRAQLLIKHSTEVLHPISVPVLAVCGECLLTVWWMNRASHFLWLICVNWPTYYLLLTPRSPTGTGTLEHVNHIHLII